MQTKVDPTPALVARRKAAAVLNSFVLDVLGMGTMAELFNGDNDDDWACVDASRVRAIRHGNLVATVEFEDDMARLEIPEARNLANRKHQFDFHPHEFGFGPQPMDWLQRREPYVIQVPVPESIPGLYRPKQATPRDQATGKPEVRRML